MELIRITDISDPLYDLGLKYYRTSFPAHEQRDDTAQNNVMSDCDYYFCALYDNDSVLGNVLFWETNAFIYLEHFYIYPQYRNKSFGSAVLALLKARGKNLILEIDPPVDDISVRRNGFYERNGLIANSHKHIHPPYHLGDLPYNLVIMSYPRQISFNEYLAFFEYMNSRIMKDEYKS